VPSTRCPKCGRQIQFELRELHAVLECAVCNQRFTPTGGAVDATSPPQQRPADEAPHQAPPRRERPQAGPASGGSSYAPEPWYYGFIAKYATVWMWLGILAISLVFLFSVVATIRAAEISAAVLAFLPVYLAFAVLGILSVIFLAALYLLAVDAARKLRSIDQKLDDSRHV
jgi:hypothetical protein